MVVKKPNYWIHIYFPWDYDKKMSFLYVYLIELYNCTFPYSQGHLFVKYCIG